MVLTQLYRFRVCAAIAAAATVGTGMAWGQGCPKGQGVPDFGYQFVSCVGCVGEYARREVAEPGYMAEPVVRLVRPNGPAAGLLMDDDSLVTVDGIDIHTRDAAVRLADGSQPARFAFRRNGIVREATVTPRLACTFAIRFVETGQGRTAVLSVAPGLQGRGTFNVIADTTLYWIARPTLSGAGTAVVPFFPPLPTSQGGWLGIGLRADSTTPAGAFVVAPTIERIDPQSPAARAGLATGLVLYSVDGRSLRSPDGPARLASVRPGDRVVLTLHGDHGWVEVTLTAEPSPAEFMDAQRASRAVVEAQLRRVQRLAFQINLKAANNQRSVWDIGSSNVEARGPGITASRDSVSGVLTIYAGTDTIVVRPKPPGGQSQRSPKKPPV